ncbi:hypothetical protein MPSEU_000344600 [Mayamaea pseudoterrestris]|nr:hypothetical protein MPSEU_000344600 [Mayamaea pseudoterrestris]
MADSTRSASLDENIAANSIAAPPPRKKGLVAFSDDASSANINYTAAAGASSRKLRTHAPSSSANASATTDDTNICSTISNASIPSPTQRDCIKMSLESRGAPSNTLYDESKYNDAMSMRRRRRSINLRSLSTLQQQPIIQSRPSASSEISQEKTLGAQTGVLSAFRASSAARRIPRLPEVGASTSTTQLPHEHHGSTKKTATIELALSNTLLEPKLIYDKVAMEADNTDADIENDRHSQSDYPVQDSSRSKSQPTIISSVHIDYSDDATSSHGIKSITLPSILTPDMMLMPTEVRRVCASLFPAASKKPRASALVRVLDSMLDLPYTVPTPETVCLAEELLVVMGMSTTFAFKLSVMHELNALSRLRFLYKVYQPMTYQPTSRPQAGQTQRETCGLIRDYRGNESVSVPVLQTARRGPAYRRSFLRQSRASSTIQTAIEGVKLHDEVIGDDTGLGILESDSDIATIGSVADPKESLILPSPARAVGQGKVNRVAICETVLRLGKRLGIIIFRRRTAKKFAREADSKMPSTSLSATSATDGSFFTSSAVALPVSAAFECIPEVLATQSDDASKC